MFLALSFHRSYLFYTTTTTCSGETSVKVNELQQEPRSQLWKKKERNDHSQICRQIGTRRIHINSNNQATKIAITSKQRSRQYQNHWGFHQASFTTALLQVSCRIICMCLLSHTKEDNRDVLHPMNQLGLGKPTENFKLQNLHQWELKIHVV